MESTKSNDSFVLSVEIQAPNPLVTDRVSVFLAGSIEMGTAIDWQRDLTRQLMGLGIAIFNPRRDDWNFSWEMSIDNPVFKEQVLWELRALEQADIIVVRFDPNTKSPITLMELGIHARSSKLIVYCPQGFWRKGNVDIVCHKYGIKQVKSDNELAQAIEERVKELIQRSIDV